MQQVTWRAPDEVLERVRAQAVAHGRSLNEWVTTVMTAASDPSLAGGCGPARAVRAGRLAGDVRPTRAAPFGE